MVNKVHTTRVKLGGFFQGSRGLFPLALAAFDKTYQFINIGVAGLALQAQFRLLQGRLPVSKSKVVIIAVCQVNFGKVGSQGQCPVQGTFALGETFRRFITDIKTHTQVCLRKPGVGQGKIRVQINSFFVHGDGSF
ncbi:hypothetical protein ES703_111855 [subsurface metagenome]